MSCMVTSICIKAKTAKDYCIFSCFIVCFVYTIYERINKTRKYKIHCLVLLLENEDVYINTSLNTAYFFENLCSRHINK